MLKGYLEAFVVIVDHLKLIWGQKNENLVVGPFPNFHLALTPQAQSSERNLPGTIKLNQKFYSESFE